MYHAIKTRRLAMGATETLLLSFYRRVHRDDFVKRLQSTKPIDSKKLDRLKRVGKPVSQTIHGVPLISQGVLL